jgi:hypothetical protein
MPHGLPGAQIQMIPSGSSSNLYTMTSPTEIQGEEPTGISINQPGSIMPNVSPYGVPYVAGVPPPVSRYSYAR